MVQWPAVFDYMVGYGSVFTEMWYTLVGKVHDMILEAMEKVILISGGKNMVMAWVDYIMAPIITLMILIAMAWVLRNWFPLIWKILSGGREKRYE